MTRKAELYLFISSGYHSFDDWMTFQRAHPFIRIKQDSQKRTLINLSEKDGWIDPKSWDTNYYASMSQRLNAAWQEFWSIADHLPDNSDIQSQFLTWMDSAAEGAVEEEHKRLLEVISTHYNEESQKRLISTLFPKS